MLQVPARTAIVGCSRGKQLVVATDASHVEEIQAQLYQLPPSEFVSARNQRAAELRTDGDKELAAAVKSLRKPAAAAWALDQLASEERPRVKALLQTVDQLRGTEDVRAWRALTDRYSDIVQELVERAAEQLSRAGLSVSAARRTELGAAIRNAASGPDRDAFEAGRLGELPRAAQEAELMWSSPTAAPDGAISAERSAARARLRKQISAARRHQRQLDREADRAERDSAAAERKAAAARRDADEAAEHLTALEHKLEELG